MVRFLVSLGTLPTFSKLGLIFPFSDKGYALPYLKQLAFQEVYDNCRPHTADCLQISLINSILRTVPTNSKVFLPRFMIMRKM